MSQGAGSLSFVGSASTDLKSFEILSSPGDEEIECHNSEPPRARQQCRPELTRNASSKPFIPRTETNPYADFSADMTSDWLYAQQLEMLWTTEQARGQGVLVKKSHDTYSCRPMSLEDESPALVEACKNLKACAAMSISNRFIRIILRRNRRAYVELNGLRLQVLQSMKDLSHCRKHQRAALITDETVLVVWSDDARSLLAHAEKLQEDLVQAIWNEGGETIQPLSIDPVRLLKPWEKKDFGNEVVTSATGVSSDLGDSRDLESCGPSKTLRPVRLNQAIITAFTVALTISAIGINWRQIAIEIKMDHKFLRLAFLLVAPIQMWLGVFFFQTIISSFAQICGPVDQTKANSKYYSGTRPIRFLSSSGLPHVTIQMPVYKESLQSVLKPTIRSIQAAIATYEMQGGTANIFVNDDGMQLLDDDQAQIRYEFYNEHYIGWVARHPHDPLGESETGRPFVRAGKFKKASNMNHALSISNRVADKLALRLSEGISVENAAMFYAEALHEVDAEEEGATWMDGDIRIGEYILLVDSDTRVPVDCLLDAVNEMAESPDVAILQYASGVLKISTVNFFESAMAFFMDYVYTYIKFAVASGDVSPFVGHNAVLRWSAFQSIATKEDGQKKYWSESAVSEDLEMSMRLQNDGWVIRLCGYTGHEFQEGVSLTVYDELSRWQKYAYGCSQIMFNPLRLWPTKSPFTPLFRQFIASGHVSLSYKLTTVAYISTYYTIASAFLLTVANYFLSGWANGFLDHYYMDSFKIYFAAIVVFGCLGNVAMAILRYRVGDQPLFKAIFQNLIWLPVLLVFFQGCSIHLCKALLSHLIGLDISWSATAKELEHKSFFEELGKVIKSFKGTFSFCLGSAGLMVALATSLPENWRITLFIAVYPLGALITTHFLLPVALNPGLMRFSW